MKYFRLHKIVWFLLCLTYLIAFEVLAYCIYNVFYFLWCFKLFKWKALFWSSGGWDNRWDGKRYVDYTPLDTLLRHYKMFK